MGDTGRKLGDRFGKHRRHGERKKKTTRTHRNQHRANHFSQYKAIGGLSLHQGNTESRKKLEQKDIDPQVIN